MITRNDCCWCGSGKKWKKCHWPDRSQELSDTLTLRYCKQYGIIVKSAPQIERIRRACQLAAYILDETCKQACRGVTTAELDAFAFRLHQAHNATPASLGYGTPPFPKSICTSLNDVICHGIPDHRPLEEGDILNIDVTCILDGCFGDCSRMVIIGTTDESRRHVTNVSHQCLERAIAVLQPGVPLSAIGETIEEYATSNGCSVVHQFVGHGVGIAFHEPPQIPHYRNHIQIPLVPGMTFTIEPMINAGVPEAIIDPTDKWTARTADGKPSAQWEHTLLITENGHEILTLCPQAC